MLDLFEVKFSPKSIILACFTQEAMSPVFFLMSSNSCLITSGVSEHLCQICSCHRSSLLDLLVSRPLSFSLSLSLSLSFSFSLSLPRPEEQDVISPRKKEEEAARRFTLELITSSQERIRTLAVEVLRQGGYSKEKAKELARATVSQRDIQVSFSFLLIQCVCLPLISVL